ncbi:protein SSUH2 homolog [Ambystoma mexicanum]|uniref:protein SSUH2 homolog n=1 Tax=Ambystoma mexicanum TaxID=8296 RepID=UPI0037E9A27D
MTEDVARDALLGFVRGRCCYGRRPAAQLVIQDLKQLVLYRYRLETFTESRLSEWTFEHYTNQGVDGPQNGQSPKPWEFTISSPGMFQEDTKKFRVPHSSVIKACHKCHGRGRYKCSGCHGAGRSRCVTCSGSRSKTKHKRCQVCSGSGRKRCNTCSGRGSKVCTTCKGEKKLLHFLQLSINWKNNLFEYITEQQQLNFPMELLSKVQGSNIFKDQGDQVYPIIDFPNSAISKASQTAISEHSAMYGGSCRILQQCQSIDLIPVTEVHYTYQEKSYLYYIYGKENKVSALEYPQRCCCGCAIL